MIYRVFRESGHTSFSDNWLLGEAYAFLDSTLAFFRHFQAPLASVYLMIYRVFRESGFTSFFDIGILSGTSKCIDTANYSEASFLVGMDNLKGYR
jgi:hypothetical protein